MAHTCLWVVVALSFFPALAYAQDTVATRIGPNAVIFVEDSEFGQALSGAILKKKVPVVVTTNREKAEFVIEESSNATKEGAAELVTKVLAFGMFAGSGTTYEASVRLTSLDVVILPTTRRRETSGARLKRWLTS
jgi:hypothetical protein